MKKWKTKHGCKISRVLSGRSNAYLVQLDNANFLVDTGTKSAFGKLIRNIHRLGLSPENLSGLILTHTHFDHCQSARRIKEISHCRILVSGAARDAVKTGYTRLPDGTFWITKGIARLGQWIGARKLGYEPFEPDILIQDHPDLYNLYSKVQILRTVGHSCDSISIIVDDEIAIVGDTMFGILKNSIFPPFADDQQQLIASWKDLLKTHCQWFMPGHGKEITRNLLQKEYGRYAQKYNQSQEKNQPSLTYKI
ncbi:MAG: MBL fold metallo-hydrolase [Candidatus Marinimicrobia bacterium]|nr:MBL fold metallo-hydrolase [Candidatus Neomarinimicrobiota bacterium]